MFGISNRAGRRREWRGVLLDLSSLAAMITLPVALAGLLLLEGCGHPANLPPAAASTPAPVGPALTRLQRSASVMGTAIELEVLAGDRATALRASEAALRALEATEARLSTWRADTELAALNTATPGRPHPISDALREDLGLALECSEITRGAFDPTVGPLVEAWDLRGEGRRPTEDQLDLALGKVGAGHLRLTEEGALKYAPLTLDEGAFGKGRGLDLALEAAREAGARGATLDLGGQLSRLPASGERDRWIPLAHPRDRQRIVAEVRLGAGSLATSGNGERGIEVEGERVGHLLDPRTGRPAEDFGSLSVLAPTAAEADCLSTGLYVLGPEAALRYAAITPGVEVFVVDTSAVGTPRIWSSDDALLRPLPASLE
ncbi:MAG: FAD:protein FMN transferase [Deltaproteobacteria bacterium]|nr:FAD:protein FMN transferase [Deltaproteobacteria bacterium]